MKSMTTLTGTPPGLSSPCRTSTPPLSAPPSPDVPRVKRVEDLRVGRGAPARVSRPSQTAERYL
ncbi:hypothetical protein [Streptomyces spongiae]|uniref:hypothetical protein n=1 Tax=Streptomyces spongiae TaxID=565072 RepID=UPI00188335D3|nr:hypothetical protein [Streptomyces spongiae]